jgi:hypothetical protein
MDPLQITDSEQDFPDGAPDSAPLARFLQDHARIRMLAVMHRDA